KKHVWQDTRAKLTFNSESTDNEIENEITVYYINVWIDGKSCSIYQIDIKEKITCMSCGNNFYVVVTDNYKTYRDINKFKVACGIHHTLALTDKGKVYGMNIYNVKKVSDIAVIDYKSFVKSSMGHIYTWGFIFNVSIKKSTSDLTIVIEKQTIYVHKAILKIRSIYFENMFRANCIESKQSIIKIRYYRYVVYKTFLEYLYTGRINLSSFEDLLDLLQLADEVCLKNLQINCTGTIKKTITVSNVIHFFNLINKMAEHYKEGTNRIFFFSIEKYVWEEITAKITTNFEAQSFINNFLNLIGTNLKMISHIYYTSHKIDWSNTRIIYYTNAWNGAKLCSIHQINIKEKIICISCAYNFYVVVTNNCKTFSWGVILFEELNPSTSSTQTSEEIEEPREIAAFTGKTIVKIACGNDYTLALCDKGKLYGWGSNLNGRLNLNYSEHILSPIMMNTDNVKKVSDIAVIDYNNFVKSSKDGLVYAWGFIFDIPFKKSAACEYTNAFDISNSMIAHSPMSVVCEFINEEFHILNDLETAFNDQSTSDLTITVEKQSIDVHKVILKIRSTYFRNMFQTNYVENSQRVIENNYYRYVVYKKFLEYLYTGEINLSSFENLLVKHAEYYICIRLKYLFVADLLQLADTLCEKNLQIDCIRKIKKTINVSNVMNLFKLINDMNEEHHKKELMKYCFNFYFKNMTTVNRTEGFEELDVETKTMLIDKGNTFLSSEIISSGYLE
ncbi:RCBT1 protein, partial [Acromyrmex charruanus]